MHLIDHELSDISKQQWENVARDSEHCSAAFRLASFTISILASFDIIESVDTETLETLFYNLPLAIQLIDDDMSIEYCNGITGLELLGQREEYMETVNDGRRVISKWISSDTQVVSEGVPVNSKLSSFWANKLDSLNGTSPLDYRIGEAFIKIMASVGSLNKTQSPDAVSYTHLTLPTNREV